MALSGRMWHVVHLDSIVSGTSIGEEDASNLERVLQGECVGDISC